jgi:glucose-1-phosphate thymidylyltransferase
LSIEFSIQDEPRGISDALLVSESFIAGEQVAMILGDNLFYGPGFGSSLKRVAGSEGAKVFGYRVSNPSDYGVVVLDQQGRAVELVEKPEGFLSNIALPGLYFLDSSAVSRARELKVSARGELEIVDLLRSYLRDELLSVELMPRGSAWLDTGTFDAMAEASEYVRTVQKRQGQIVGSPEEAAWRQGLISDSDLASLADPLRKSGYGKYLLDLLEDKA